MKWTWKDTILALFALAWLTLMLWVVCSAKSPAEIQAVTDMANTME